MVLVVIGKRQQHLPDDLGRHGVGNAAGIIGRGQLVDVAAHHVAPAAHQRHGLPQRLEGHAARFRGAGAGKDRRVQHIQIHCEVNRPVTQHGDSILRLAYAYLHNMSDAEDVLQDTLLQFLKTAPVLENPDHEKAWLLRVAGNLSKNRIAYNRVRGADELEESLAAEQREDLSYVWDAVKSLPVKYREVIHLFYYEGYSTGQIAQLLRMNESTVRSRLRRGREQLKSILQEVPGLVDGL